MHDGDEVGRKIDTVALGGSSVYHLIDWGTPPRNKYQSPDYQFSFCGISFRKSVAIRPSIATKRLCRKCAHSAALQSLPLPDPDAEEEKPEEPPKPTENPYYLHVVVRKAEDGKLKTLVDESKPLAGISEVSKYAAKCIGTAMDNDGVANVPPGAMLGGEDDAISPDIDGGGRLTTGKYGQEATMKVSTRTIAEVFETMERINKRTKKAHKGS